MKKAPAKKRTSKKVASPAARLQAMSDDEMWKEALGSPPCMMSRGLRWAAFCQKVRSICGSALSQAEK